MHIETQRLIVRDFSSDDAGDLHDILGNDEVMLHCEPAYDFEQTRDFLESFCIARKGGVAAEHKASRKVIGYILFNELEDGVYELGWFFNRSFWRQGYAFEACKAVVDHTFNNLGAHKIFAETIDGAKSVGLMMKLGMKLEGIQRSHTKDGFGNWADMHLYGLLDEDFK